MEAATTSYKDPGKIMNDRMNLSDFIPKNPIGKVLKRVLRERFGGEVKSGNGACQTNTKNKNARELEAEEELT